MYKILFVIIALLALTATSVSGDEGDEANEDFLVKEKFILELFKHVYQKSIVPEIVEIANTYKIEDNIDEYTNPEVVRTFLNMFNKEEMMKPDEIFSVLNKNQLKQAIKLFDIFYFANSWDTFSKTAAWARNNVHRGMFMYALLVAISHREDTKTLILPPPHEIYPHFFIKDGVIKKAYDEKMKMCNGDEANRKILIEDMVSDEEYILNEEKHIAYFTEDIGLNIYNLLYHVKQPFWMSPDKYGKKYDRRGEVFWFTQAQVLKRYQIEKLTIGFYDSSYFNYDKSIIVGYSPHLGYANGEAMPVRPELGDFRDIDVQRIELLKDLERRIKDVVDLGLVIDENGHFRNITEENGVDIIGSIIEETCTFVNPNYYGNLYQLSLKLIGEIIDPVEKFKTVPNALVHFETMLRDPMYYIILSRINKLFKRYNKHLPSYSAEDLAMTDIKIENLEVDELVTFNEPYEIDITNAVSFNSLEDEAQTEIKVRQSRLNHKPFTFKITVNSEKETKVMVRTFIGLKSNYDGRELSQQEKQKYMVEIDRFATNIQVGENILERNSGDMGHIVHDPINYRTLLNSVNDALEGLSPMHINKKNNQCGFPNNLLLPKGTPNGKAYSLISIITPLEDDFQHSNADRILACGAEENIVYYDKYPLGFPFDREITETVLHDIPNLIQKDIIIHHYSKLEG